MKNIKLKLSRGNPSLHILLAGMMMLISCCGGTVFAKGKKVTVTTLPNGAERRHTVSRSPHDDTIKSEVIEDRKDGKLIRREESKWPWKKGSWIKSTEIVEYDEQGRKTLIGELSELHFKNTKHSRFAHYTFHPDGTLKEERIEISKVRDDEDYAWTEIYAYFLNGKIRIRQIPTWKNMAVVGVKNTQYSYYDDGALKSFHVRRYDLQQKILRENVYSYNKNGSLSRGKTK